MHIHKPIVLSTIILFNALAFNYKHLLLSNQLNFKMLDADIDGLTENDQ